MQGIELSSAPGPVIKKAHENGLIIISAGGNVIRLLPPLVITEAEIDIMADILDKILD